ncbi:hypothetical protein MXMO3_00929 [Maritalea myrionectae]|uniref:Uncharacterized protein n=1 Tax=Maritalea myrionectae TaxID=454601 RepID=A0A2R4MBT5_9HYPH|nr:hypothetical protein [Maritalea myrionectae]AVX03460.1 hypothetical protein MXMO3_00929 [Maritalea myrionectae]
MALPTIEEVISLYLYGQNTPPSDLSNGSLLRGPDATSTTDPISVLEYMTTGAGRFACASNIELVSANSFFEGWVATG